MRDDSRMFAARTAIAMLAVLAAAWFAVSVRQAHDTARAQTAVSAAKSIGSQDAARVTAWLNAAAWLNPDREVDILRGRLALLQHEPARSEHILLGVTRSEPMNLEAWVYLAQAAFPRDPKVLQKAVIALARLHPKPR